MRSPHADPKASGRRALVLGGGGAVGGYWETRLLRGLFDRGIDVFGFDAIVGTSAGSIAAVTLANQKTMGASPRHG
jgi:NTE family protein